MWVLRVPTPSRIQSTTTANRLSFALPETQNTYSSMVCPTHRPTAPIIHNIAYMNIYIINGLIYILLQTTSAICGHQHKQCGLPSIGSSSPLTPAKFKCHKNTFLEESPSSKAAAFFEGHRLLQRPPPSSVATAFLDISPPFFTNLDHQYNWRGSGVPGNVYPLGGVSNDPQGLPVWELGASEGGLPTPLPGS